MSLSRGLIAKVATAILLSVVLVFASVIVIQTTPVNLGFADFIFECPDNECLIREEEPPTCPALPVLTSSATAQANVGKNADKITFTFVVTNNDILIAKGVEFLAVVPKTLEVVNFTATKGLITHNTGSNNVKATLPVLKPGESVTVTVTTKLSATALANMTYYVGGRVRYGDDCDTRQFFTNWLPFYPMGG